MIPIWMLMVPWDSQRLRLGYSTEVHNTETNPWRADTFSVQDSFVRWMKHHCHVDVIKRFNHNNLSTATLFARRADDSDFPRVSRWALLEELMISLAINITATVHGLLGVPYCRPGLQTIVWLISYMNHPRHASYCSSVYHKLSEPGKRNRSKLIYTADNWQEKKGSVMIAIKTYSVNKQPNWLEKVA